MHAYGLTETTAAVTSCALDDQVLLGHVGAPLPCCDVKLVPVPAMGCETRISEDNPYPKGEIWVRGANVFAGYYKNPEKTAEDLTSDGWLKTGDLGRWNPNGTLSIVGRKKEIFKLSQGEYVAPDFVEAILGKSEWCSQVFVYGNSYKPCLVCVVVPDAQKVQHWAQEQGFWKYTEGKSTLASSFYRQALAAVIEEHREALSQLILTDLQRLCTSKQVKAFKIPQAVWLESDVDALGQGWSTDNNCLTPSFKLKRPQLIERYLKTLQSLYTKLGHPPQDAEKWY